MGAVHHHLYPEVDFEIQKNNQAPHNISALGRATPVFISANTGENPLFPPASVIASTPRGRLLRALQF